MKQRPKAENLDNILNNYQLLVHEFHVRATTGLSFHGTVLFDVVLNTLYRDHICGS